MHFGVVAERATDDANTDHWLEKEEEKLLLEILQLFLWSERASVRFSWAAEEEETMTTTTTTTPTTCSLA
jgi:hypothetical protein